MFTLDYKDRRPVYEQIKAQFKKLIASGILAEGTQIPSVRELAATLAINPNTIQRAYKELEIEGYIYSMRAKGSFVAPKQHTISARRKAELLLQMNAILSELRFGGVEKKELIDYIDRFCQEEGK